MRNLSRFLAVLVPFISLQPVLAADSAAVRRAIEDYLQTQTRELPGNPTPIIGRIDAERLPGACEGMTVTMSGNRRWGATQVAVSCRGGAQRLFVQVEIPVVADYLVAARPVGAGQKLTEADVGTQLGRLPNDALMDRTQVIGHIAKNSLSAGLPLRADMFRLPWVVQQGQNVRVVVIGNGFEASKEGRALNNAAVGQDIQVRINSSSTVTGVARADGSVEVRN